MSDRREPYSIRQKRKGQEDAPLVYQYDKIPKLLPAQVMYGLRLASRAASRNYGVESYWSALETVMAAEHGYVMGLPGMGQQTPEGRVAAYLGNVRKIEHFLDVTELGIQIAYQYADDQTYVKQRREARIWVDEGVEEINYRFRFHACGYQYVGAPGLIMRIDSQFIQSEAVEPAVLQLHQAGWEGPLSEFLSAYRYLRRGENKAAMNDALKAFESTMKAILHERGIPLGSQQQAKHLIAALIQNGVILPSLDGFLSGIRNILSDGVPTLRNTQSGHGQGRTVTEVPDYLAAFALNITASNIVFLIEAHKASQKAAK